MRPDLCLYRCRYTHRFPVRWQFMNDSSLKNITAWVSKKVPELVGMEEPDLVDFIMANVRKQVSAGEYTFVGLS